MEVFTAVVVALVPLAVTGLAILAFKYPEPYHAINDNASFLLFSLIMLGGIWMASNAATIFVISNSLSEDAAEIAKKSGSSISIPFWLYVTFIGLFLYFRLLDYLAAKRPGANPKHKWPGVDDDK